MASTFSPLRCSLVFTFSNPFFPLLAITFDKPGTPSDVLHLAQLPLPTPRPGEVRMKVVLSAINPSDLMFVQNKYGIRPQLPGSGAGFEAVGIVDACGEGVDIPLGTRACFTTVGTWAEYVCASAKALIPVPAQLPDTIAAQFFVNPYTACAMVEASGVQPGGWLMLSAAGSALGKLVIQYCKQKGIKTIGTVRRPDLMESLLGLGADAIVDLSKEDPFAVVKSLTEGKGVGAILDAVAGETAAQLLPCLARGGKMLVYGSLSLADIPVPAGLLIFKEISLQGFWLSSWMKTVTPADYQAIARSVVALLTDEATYLPVEAIYPLQEIAQAVTHAAQEGRSGKILLRCG